jgi:hypothetical protein
MSLLHKEQLKRSLSGSLDMLKHFSNNFLETSLALQKQLAELEQKEKKWQELEMRVKRNADKAAELITLDVGGSLFTTSKENLLRQEGTYFQAMLGSDHWKPNSKGMENVRFMTFIDKYTNG